MRRRRCHHLKRTGNLLKSIVHISMSEQWAFTIKCNKNCMTDDELRTAYQLVMQKWKDHGVFIDKYIYEDETKHGERTKLHVHGICTIKRGLYRKKLMVKGFGMKLVPFTSAGWEDYMVKHLKIKLVAQKKNGENDESFSELVPSRPVSPQLTPPTHRLF